MADDNGKLHLSEMMTPNLVRARVTAADWQAAVRLAGQLLLDGGCVKPRYVEAMERSLRELGPYAVLAPGIVLLHARPEDGVINPCLSLVTLSTPVPFGHSHNDPVDLVFALGAVNKESHLRALQQLAGLLMNTDFLSDLRAAKTGDDLFKMMNIWYEKTAGEGDEREVFKGK